MKLKIIVSIALSVGVAAMLSACDGSAGYSGTPATGSAFGRRIGHAWMAPNSSSENLLYVTGACGGVCVFAYPSGTLVGELSDSNSPLGECADKNGDIFVVNFGSNGTPGVYEYAHGGTSPIAELSDPGYNPESCSIDPTTGNLAVTNDSGGVVAIYLDAKGDPTDYVDPNIYYMGFCGYDDKGNLFVDGQFDHKGTFRLDELTAGSSEFKNVRLTQKPPFPLNIQWAGKYLALADSGTVIYHVKVSGSKGTVTGTTVLNGPVSGIEVQFWIQGKTIIAPYGASESPDEVGFWKYPTGGRIRKSISGSEFDDAELFGVTVSLANK